MCIWFEIFDWTIFGRAMPLYILKNRFNNLFLVVVFFRCRDSVVGKISRLSLYVQQLKAAKTYFTLSKRETFALADCDENGKLNKAFVVLERLHFCDGVGETIHLFVCSCDKGSEQRDILSMTNKLILEECKTFVEREKDIYCIHSKTAEILEIHKGNFSDEDLDGTDHANVDEEDNLGNLIDQLSLDPLVVGVFDGTSYGVLSREERSQTGRLRCRSCKTNVHMCPHIRAYRGWCEEHDIEIEPVETTGTGCFTDGISFQKIPYPLPDDMKLFLTVMNAASASSQKS